MQCHLRALLQGTLGFVLHCSFYNHLFLTSWIPVLRTGYSKKSYFELFILGSLFIFGQNIMNFDLKGL